MAGEDSSGGRSVMCNEDTFPDDLSRLTGSDSGGGCGVIECATPNKKILLGAVDVDDKLVKQC